MKPINSKVSITFPSSSHGMAISELNHILISEWENWVAQAEPGRGEKREAAFIRLTECLKYNFTTLDLSSLSLTELPEHLPGFLIVLNIEENQLADLPNILSVSLECLNVNGNRLTHLPNNLPVSLTNLLANNNQLIELPNTLPCGLQNLYVDSNRLTHLPSNLPISLTSLFADNNQLTELPNTFPDGLKNLYVNYNRLTCLPDNLPDSLTIIESESNALTYLPDNLPLSLNRLNLENNHLSQLPVHFPNALVQLNLSYNHIEQLPQLPISLAVLRIEHNQLSYLPEILPNDLEVLEISYNPLQRFPIYFPHSLRSLNINLDQAPLLQGYLPTDFTVWAGPDIISWGISRPFYAITPEEWIFISKIGCWGKVDINRWRRITLEENADIFADFVQKLYQGLNMTNTPLRRRVLYWLDYLAKEANNDVRKLTFLIAQEATESCVDRASFYFNKMYLLIVENDLIKNKHIISIAQVINTVLGMFRLQELEKIAVDHVNRRRVLSPSFSEDIEIYLAYQYRLQKELSLPIYAGLQFEAVADLTIKDLVDAKNAILVREKNQFLSYLVMESKSWNDILEEWNSEKIRRVKEDYLEEISSDSFEQKIQQILKENNLSEHNEDAYREVKTTMANGLLYKRRYELTIEFLTENNALMLINTFRSD